MKTEDAFFVFLEATPKKVFMIFMGEHAYAKVSQKLFGQVRAYSGKNPSHPQKFACSYTYVSSQQHNILYNRGGQTAAREPHAVL